MTIRVQTSAVIAVRHHGPADAAYCVLRAPSDDPGPSRTLPARP
jgi:hypothetical protein